MATEIERRERSMARIYRVIDRSRIAWRIIEVANGLLRTFAVMVGCLVVGFAADNVLHLPGLLRLGLGVLVLGALAFMLTRFVLYPLARPLTDEMVAVHVERAFPGLDNRVINSVLLSAQKFRDSLTGRMAASQIRETAARVAAQRLPVLTGTRGLRKSVRWAVVLVGVVLLYGLLFSRHFTNAFMRFVYPCRYIPPVTATRLEVSPGDAALLQGSALAVEARVSGVLPETARIHVQSKAGGGSSDTMGFEGNAFTYLFANVQHDFTYSVEAGDAATPRYKVTVCERPAVRQLDITYCYPAYTGLPERMETDAVGDIRAPVGTMARLLVKADRPVRTGYVEVKYPATAEQEAPPSETFALLPEAAAAMRTEVPVLHSGRYTVTVADEREVSNIPQVRQIEAVPDSPPRVFFEQPAKDVAVAPDARVALLAAAEDDFSLRELHLFIQPRAGADWERFRSWTYEPGTRAAREGCLLDMRELGLGPGSALAYYMQANDGLRREDEEVGRSRTYYVRVVDAVQEAGAGESVQEALRDAIRKLIELQKANLEGTRGLAGWAAGNADLDRQEELPGQQGAAWADFRQRVAQLHANEEAIYTFAGEAVTRYAGQEASITEALGRIAAGEMSRAVELLKRLQDAPDREAVQLGAGEAADRETAIVALLERLLSSPAALLAEMLKEEGRQEAATQEEAVTDARQLAEKLLKALDSFAEDQRHVVEMSNRLAEKPADDFTNDDEKALQGIIQAEKEWMKFFQEMVTDLSKLPPQDMSLATQAKEILEVYSEMQRAVEEAERRAIEMAVPHEQAGLELAQSIETNIEKWLMETKDNQLWSMEEPMEEHEVPLAELPKELQDLIGDLVESEEEMLEEFDDATSGWTDSADLGAGWDTMDGPISNMSAKGVTGNRLPNTQEIGGRSGEGRTGKSSGQFVEEEATGKGGRQTPSRLTPDPFEAGWVRDTSGEAPTGATGGGKVSGQGAEGFYGPVPPPLRQRLKRMAIRQGELIDKAKRLDYGLKKYQQPRGELPKAIELMQTQQMALEQGELSTFVGSQRILLSNLREVKELSEKQKQLWRDRSALLPKQLRDEIASSRDEKVPEQYRAMVESYFRALSEAGTARR